jgi:formylglycine-generating enzyme required for sulfatase activity
MNEENAMNCPRRAHRALAWVVLGVVAGVLVSCSTESPSKPDEKQPVWASTIRHDPDPSIVTDPTVRADVKKTGLAWHVRDKATDIELVLIPPGTYMRGASPGDSDAESDEKPRHRVTITKPFYMGRTEVTQEQWKKVMASEPWSGKNFVNTGVDHAASYIWWDDATAFCLKAGFRLPTEAEWEYACRAGSTTKFCFGDNDSVLGDYAWYDGNADSKGAKYAHTVGQKSANAFGLFDIHGNVWEWCRDGYDSEAYARSSDGVTDPFVPATGDTRVLRGGSWDSYPRFCRSSSRGGDIPTYRPDDSGFRVARAP